MSTISKIYNGVLDYCISNRQIKLDIWRKTNEAKGDPAKERELATEFLKKAKEASERYNKLRGKESLQALDEWDLYSRAANRLVGILMAMAIYDSPYYLEEKESSNKKLNI